MSRATVLILEDDDLTRGSLRRVLTARGFDVLGAATGQQARDLCGHHMRPIDLLLCDVFLPDVDGFAIAGELLELRPNLKIVLMSAHTDLSTLRPDTVVRGFELLEKPFTNVDLTLKIQTLLASSAA